MKTYFIDKLKVFIKDPVWKHSVDFDYKASWIYIK